MYRRSFSSRRRSGSRKVKYSNETFSVNTSITQNGGALDGDGFVVVDSLNALGTRKFKNPRLTVSCSKLTANGVEYDQPVYFALIYVPEGIQIQPTDLHVGQGLSTSLYEPNQNVILQGLIHPGQTYTFSNRLGRNLDAGDQIICLFISANQNPDPVNASTQNIYATVNYAISF